ncbi:MAG: TonB-dependent receptor [Bacteroidetes bacterium]|nr:TonB-dependent receptor [Bacteroidota bacterium]MCL2303207.1 TonB-dependent receptor [Lentimicrobiaceae bacterium]
MKKIIIAIIFALNIISIHAQQPTDANIVGHVLDSKTQEHLAYVSIGIKGTDMGTVSDATGHYRINNIPVGTFTIVASYIGYEPQEIEINVEKGKTLEVNFELDESPLLLNQIVVSAGKDEVSRIEAVSIVNVITPRIFENTNSVCLADGLNFLPGLRVENNCQNCGFSQLRINGLDGPYTQVLIDSRAINSALAGVYGLEHIPVNMVDRVEVVRGGASALFGSSAVGGVVNIITKEPRKNALSISNISNLIYGKSPDIITNLNASIVSNKNIAGATLFASARQRSPFDYNKDGFSEIGKLNMKSIGFRGFYNINRVGKLTLEYHTIDEFRRGGNNFNRPPHEADIAEQTDHTIHSGGYKFDSFFKNPKHALQTYSSYQHINRKSYYGTGQDPNAYGYTTDLSMVSGIQYTFRMNRFLFMPATLITGFEYSHNALKDEMLGYNRVINEKVSIYSVFAQNEWRNTKVSILLGGRFDKHSMIKNPIISPRISARYAPISWLTLRGSYASGFRGPQTYDEDLHIAAVGGVAALIQVAENLKPEKSHSFTFSTEFNKLFPKTAFQFLAEGFYTNLSNVFVIEEVSRDEAGNLILERTNGSGAVVAGVNLEATILPMKDFQINMGFTVQSSLYKEPEQWSENVEPQRKMFRAPSNYGYIMATYSPIRRLDLSLSGIYTGSMLVQHFSGYIPEDREVKTPVFFDLNFRIAYNFKLKENVMLQVSAGMKNIFNSYQKDFDKGEFRDSRYIYGPTLPRTVFLGIRFSI